MNTTNHINNRRDFVAALTARGFERTDGLFFEKGHASVEMTGRIILVIAGRRSTTEIARTYDDALALL